MTIEEKIVEYQRTRDEVLFEELLEQFEPMLRATSKQFSRNQHYEDILQDQRLLFLECLNRFKIEKGFKFSTFFWVSATGNAKRVWAKYNEWSPWTSLYDQPQKLSINAEQEGFKKIVLVAKDQPDIDMMLDMEKMIDGLQEDEQLLIKAHFWKGLKVVEIAEVEGVVPATIHLRIEKILNKLRGFYAGKKRKYKR